MWAEESVETEIRGKHEGAAVVGVVALEEIGHGGLWRSGFEGGMRVDHAGGSEKSGIGDAPDAGFAVVVGNIFQEPVDGVVEVAAVVDVGGGFFDVDVRAHFDEFAFGHEAAANVLHNENVAGFVKVRRRAELGAILIDAVGRDAVRSAADEEGMGA